MSPERGWWEILIVVGGDVHGVLLIQNIRALFQSKIACPDKRTCV